MNLVMHQLLSFDNPAWQVGNHLGEIVKGKKHEEYPDDLQKGILLHRFIDSFSDSHDMVKNSTSKLHKNYSKFSPIIVDVYYDFLLIKNWHLFSQQTFEEFKDNCYRILQDSEHLYPPKLLKFTQALIKHDWFEKYSTYEGLEITLSNMSSRTSFENNMHMAVRDLYLNEAQFEEDFLKFMPEIVRACEDFLDINKLNKT
ncbi:acyl carrier protein phosphodiesterase [Weeksellaceae bacterium KMM 9713]|uniref:Acyl carrier protein phosphodiesterase n=2 Tax=Pseudomonadati TaxID=3379134 RepID=A0A9X4N0M8_9FLAO|nr:acyl carrier protein phosphodiesterase [Profundicola chukchiensis]MDG4946181.1 acyl carrier protein phosphodiesterase [Profundicola chukchiensis]